MTNALGRDCRDTFAPDRLISIHDRQKTGGIVGRGTTGSIPSAVPDGRRAGHASSPRLWRYSLGVDPSEMKV
jgi:hypothetical protein